jgi:hypothetical protein
MVEGDRWRKEIDGARREMMEVMRRWKECDDGRSETMEGGMSREEGGCWRVFRRNRPGRTRYPCGKAFVDAVVAVPLTENVISL